MQTANLQAIRADLDGVADQALQRLRRQGFEYAQVDAQWRDSAEVSLSHDQPSLMRSGRGLRLGLTGLVDGRRASTDLSDFSPEALDAATAALWQATLAAPQDPAHAVSAGQCAELSGGDTAIDTATNTRAGHGDDDAQRPAELADGLAELLAWRSRHTPSVMLEESFIAHHRQLQRTLTSAGSAIASSLAWYEVSVMGTARDGARSSSFNIAGGTCWRLSDSPLPLRFGLDDMLRGLVAGVHAQPLGEKFVGSVLLAPAAVQDLIGWLLEQLSDAALISGSSLYISRVGQAIASPGLSLHHRTGLPGIPARSADAFVVQPVAVLQAGSLSTLLPSLYGSRKTGHPHVPLAAGGWALDAGDTPLASLQAGVTRGALVGRLSMGRPAPNGDFSGVIKNGVQLRDGTQAGALYETMISGNIAQMLQSVSGVSRERVDTGGWCLPWLRVDGLHFS